MMDRESPSQVAPLIRDMQPFPPTQRDTRRSRRARSQRDERFIGATICFDLHPDEWIVDAATLREQQNVRGRLDLKPSVRLQPKDSHAEWTFERIRGKLDRAVATVRGGDLVRAVELVVAAQPAAFHPRSERLFVRFGRRSDVLLPPEPEPNKTAEVQLRRRGNGPAIDPREHRRCTPRLDRPDRRTGADEALPTECGGVQRPLVEKRRPALVERCMCLLPQQRVVAAATAARPCDEHGVCAAAGNNLGILRVELVEPDELDVQRGVVDHEIRSRRDPKRKRKKDLAVTGSEDVLHRLPVAVARFVHERPQGPDSDTL